MNTFIFIVNYNCHCLMQNRFVYWISYVIQKKFQYKNDFRFFLTIFYFIHIFFESTGIDDPVGFCFKTLLPAKLKAHSKTHKEGLKSKLQQSLHFDIKKQNFALKPPLRRKTFPHTKKKTHKIGLCEKLWKMVHACNHSYLAF